MSTTDRDEGGRRSLDAGRYVYCLVRLPPTVDSDDPSVFDVEGIDGEPPRLLACPDHGIGAVVHETDALYDSEDLATLRAWLLAHHRVIEAATEEFGTPIPFQFDVIIEGGDTAVRSVIDAGAASIDETLSYVEGRREYRIELLREPDATVPDPDGELASLREQIEVATEGTAFLLEKKLERKRTALLREQANALTAQLYDAIEPVIVESTASKSEQLDFGERDDRETLATVAVLASHDRESELGASLDPIAANPDVAIRFTGPWAPYSFVTDVDWEGS